MLKCTVFVVAGLLAGAAVAVVDGGEPPARRLVWSDEFDGAALDPAKWGYELGFIRNREYQYYTNLMANVRVENGKYVSPGMAGLPGETPSDGFHVYAMEWDERGMTCFYDGRPYGRFSFKKYGDAFAKPHYILLNRALGAPWMLPEHEVEIDEGMRFEIDWIRVYE